jgi:hypothetical protein
VRVYTPDHSRDQEEVDAAVKARGDRGRLASLRRAGKVRRHDGDYELGHPELSKVFVRDIEERAKPGINLAIRPKKRKKR